MLFPALILPLLPLALAQKCPIQFDGRVANRLPLEAFDTNASPYNPSYVLGSNQKWSSVLKFPSVNASLFDANVSKAVEVTVNDQSIFAPSADNVQKGFRRAELLPVSVTGTDASTTGQKTIHFSVQKDAARPLNSSHEYQLFFLESNDYSTNQVTLKYGTIIGGKKKEADMLTVTGNVNANPVKTVFETRFTPGVWHNFGIVLDFSAGTTQVYYSTNQAPLASTGKAVTNSVSGQGQYHFGILKKPIGGGSDLPHSGYQPSKINEGVIFGGIFAEDSKNGCVSLQK
ncbi:hypothetical protein GLAREA_06417 [Glarea lozoyensis ATCC 20868]|uniref:Glycoside hydrolase 131 catalytic N-terminal domain-containing protein n=1 Tax=Glarea lozoyensis (strain ATCC 20868 / MF5171) TaxID=1116229 RepID=S3D8D7_GLAL2|nr:uncharacterized protein GLAREA_06417 [Glarea lozoyensis ATCC 20868]EPE33404.1 hypothetical protein GLAREA_06417 [Glarea lozoyensis ATCC 20868]